MSRISLLKVITVVMVVVVLWGCAPNPYSDVTTLLGSKGPAAKERAAKRLAGMKGDLYIDALVKALYDPHQRVIIAAADALAKSGAVEAVPDLEKLLGDGREDVQRAAASALSRIKDISAAEALVRSEIPRYRSMGIDMLGRLHSPGTIPALAFALKDRDPANRLQAVKLLSSMNNEEAAKALKEASEDPDASVRAEAVKGLVAMEGAAAFVSLSASSENSVELAEKMSQLALHFVEQDSLRAAIAAEANSLARYITFYCTNYVQQDIYSDRDKSLTTLYFIDTPEIISEEMELISSALLGAELTDIAMRQEDDYLQPGRYTPRSFVSAIGTENEENEFVTETVRYLEKVIAADTKSLVVVDGKQPSARQYALLGLSYIDSTVAAQALLKAASANYYDYFIIRGLVDLGVKAKQSLISALKSEETFVRSQAMLALAFLSDPEVGQLAEQQLKIDSDPIVRLHSQFALYQAGRTEMFDKFIEAAESDDLQTALRATYLLWYVQEPIPEKDLLRLIQHTDNRIRRRAADICAKRPIDSDAFISALISLLGDKSKQVRSSAKDALAAIDRKALPAIREAVQGSDRDLKESAAQALVKMGGEESVRLILGLLDDSSAALRAYAAQSLGNLAGELGRSELADRVARKLSDMLETENSIVVLRGCLTSLGKLRYDDSAKTIIQLMEKKPAVGKEAAIALAEMSGSAKAERHIMGKFKRLDGNYLGFSPLHSDKEYEQLFFISYPAAVLGNENAKKRIKNVLMQGDFKDRIVAAEFLGRLGDEEYLDSLIEVSEYKSKGLEPFDFYVRKAAQRAAIELLLKKKAESGGEGV
ncbi:MAG: HEAT repeat domain-containing protein [Candidatus Coatesbacteria bacterium]|nr:HEAT repeat domain-containing protein [Candidatus Coatesbacteria bacterium]